MRIMDSLPPADRIRVLANSPYWFIVCGSHYLTLAAEMFGRLDTAMKQFPNVTPPGGDPTFCKDLLAQIEHAKAIACVAIRDEYHRDRVSTNDNVPLAMAVRATADAADTAANVPAVPKPSAPSEM